jgi:hypothetical protein
LVLIYDIGFNASNSVTQIRTIRHSLYNGGNRAFAKHWAQFLIFLCKFVVIAYVCIQIRQYGLSIRRVQVDLYFTLANIFLLHNLLSDYIPTIWRWLSTRKYSPRRYTLRERLWKMIGDIDDTLDRYSSSDSS